MRSDDSVMGKGDIDLRLVDPARLEIWLDGHAIPPGPITELALIAGGTQNVLARFRRGGRHYVLRRPSLTPRPEATKTIRREARVLGALAGTDVPHPPLVAFCDDAAVLGAEFYVMERVEGFNPTLGLPAPFDNSPEAQQRLGLAMVDGIAALSRLDPIAIGLSDFGKLDGFLERQVPRWAGQLESYGQFPDWAGPQGLGDVAAIGDWLAAHVPAQMQPGLMHGDYHLGNVLFDAQGGLAAIIDWELSTLGDPLLDLGRLLAAWPDKDGNAPLSLSVKPWLGFPERAMLVDHYAASTGRPLDDLLWFEVLACYKLGIILEGTFARASAGVASADTGERLHRSANALLRRAEEWISERG